MAAQHISETSSYQYQEAQANMRPQLEHRSMRSSTNSAAWISGNSTPIVAVPVHEVVHAVVCHVAQQHTAEHSISCCLHAWQYMF